jgi:hypothetical protein
MLTFLAVYGPDSWFGWLVLLFVASLPVLVLSAVVLVVIVRIALAAMAHYRPPAPSAGEFTVPPDPEATAAFLRDRALDKRERSRHEHGSGES